MKTVNITKDKKGLSLNDEEKLECLAKYAQQAVLYEAVLSPKPGLVDPIDAGSHSDMNIFTFIDSASTLYKGFYNFAKIGYKHEGTEEMLFHKIRQSGMELEKKMFDETKGINTHKGIIFSMGLFLSAIAYSIGTAKDNQHVNDWQASSSNHVFDVVKQMTAGIIENDFKNLHRKDILTNGEKLYLKYGFLGIRGEAEQGYPILRDTVLPVIRQDIERNKYNSKSDLYLDILFLLIANTDDSNIVTRSGIDGLKFAKNKAEDFIIDGGVFQQEADLKIKNINNQFIKRRISPGGSADLLALAIFFSKLERLDDCLS